MTGEGWQVGFADLTAENADGPRRLVVKFVVCPSPDCRKFSLSVRLHDLKVVGNRSYTGKLSGPGPWCRLRAPGPFRSLIPSRIMEDYQEACLAMEQSPKAAAALCPALSLGNAARLLAGAARQPQ